MAIDSGDSSPVADAGAPFDSTMEAEADAGADERHEDTGSDAIDTDGFGGDGQPD
jgi:hypothetical protein